MTLALLCPGQGAQQVGMGKDFYATYGVARRVYDQADKELGFALSKFCFEGPEETLNKTDIAQLAIFVTSVAIYETLLELGTATVPDYAAGLSLGEYTALHIAGVFSFEDGLKLVKARGSLMQAAAEAAPSAMLAVLVDEPTAINLCNEAAQGEVLIAANFNTPHQTILSGSVGACKRATDLGHAKGFHCVPLKVAGAFHSSYMQPAADQLAEVLNSVTFNTPTIPVISNVNAKPHIDPASIRESLVQQVVSPVRWYQTMQTLIGMGVGQWIEVGPGRSLTGMLKKIDRKAPIQNFSLAEGLPPAKVEIGVTDFVKEAAFAKRETVK